MSYRTPAISLSALVVLPGLLTSFMPHAGPGGAVCAVTTEMVDLQTTGKIAMATGTISLKPAMSPFGLAVTAEGRGIFEATTTIRNLPEAASLGAQFNAYVLWVASPSLDQIRNLGVITNGVPVSARVDLVKMMYMVTAEPAANVKGANFKGAIVLVGRSASARVQNLAGCDIYDQQNGGMGG